MAVVNLGVGVAVAIGLVLTCRLVWPRLADDVRQPMMVYVGSYLLTYCVGGIWIGLSNGQVLATYFKDQNIYIPSVQTQGVEYWYILLAPLVIPMCIAALLVRERDSATKPRLSLQPTRWQFAVIFAAFAGYAIVGLFRNGLGVVDALSSITNLQGDTATLIEKRVELFDTGTAVAFGIVYSALPALSHVALFKARYAGKSWRAVAIFAVCITLMLSIATFQIAPAVVFLAALVVGAAHLQWVRMTWAKIAGLAGSFLFVLQALNSWKFGDWTFFENVQHIVFRMPSAYLYYLDCFPGTVPFLGTDWVGSLTGHGLDPGAPFVVSRVMYPGSLIEGAMAAPAHVQGYAEGGALNAMLCIAVVGVVIAGCAVLRRKSRTGALWHGVYIQGLVLLYYTTQTSFRGVVWHGYGILWSLLALGALGAMSFDLTEMRARSRSVQSVTRINRWRTVDATRR